MKTKIRCLYILLLFTSVTQIVHANKAEIQKMLDEEEDITLWKELIEAIVRSDDFQEFVQKDPEITQECLIEFLRNQTLLLSRKDRYYILDFIESNPELYLQDVYTSPIPKPMMIAILSKKVRNKKVERNGSFIYKPVFIKNILLDKAIAYVKAKRMVKLQEELQDLKEIVEIQNELVADQGDSIDTLEKNTNEVKVNVQKAQVNVKKAKTNYWESQSIYYTLIALLVLLILIGIAFFLIRRQRGSVSNKKS